MKLICSMAVLLVLLFTGHGSSAGFYQFSGKWKNNDPNTGGLTTLHIEIKDKRVEIQVWGRCRPKDCAWGYADGTAYGPSVGADPIETTQVVSVIYITSFSNTILLIRPIEGGQLMVESMTRFTDESCRSSYTRIEKFSRVNEADAAQ